MMGSTLTNLLYHIVFSTKNRRPLIMSDVRDELHRYLGGIIRGEGGIAIDIGGMPDHVHILAKLKPNVAVSDVLRVLKANSSKWCNDKFASQRDFGWQDGYAAFSVSESQAQKVAEYIRNQEEHHRQRDFKSELIELLRRHGIEFNEQYLWD
jgi:putative transposase